MCMHTLPNREIPTPWYIQSMIDDCMGWDLAGAVGLIKPVMIIRQDRQVSGLGYRYDDQ